MTSSEVFASQAATAVANSGGVSREPEPQADTDTHDDVSNNLKNGNSKIVAASESDSVKTEEPATELLASVEGLSSAEETAPTSPTDVESKVASMLSDAFQGWQFDALAFAEITDNKPLSTLGLYLFEHLGFTQQFGLDTQKLGNFFIEIEKGYDDANAYHNRAHAASVMHAMHALLQHGGVANVIAPAFSGHGSSSLKFGNLQRLACLLAAAVHDHEHLGLTNDYLVRTRHESALIYNDQHVNEHHHVASSFAVLQRPECNFLANLSEDEFYQLRSIVIELVLGTDMAKGANIHTSFNSAFGLSAEASAPPQPTPASRHDAVLLMQMAMKCADLGHLALPWETHRQWVARVEAEFFAQGDKEKAAGLQVSLFMDRDEPGCSQSQTGFFEGVALPLFRSLVQVAPLAQPMLDSAMANYHKWQEMDGPRICIRLHGTKKGVSDTTSASPSDESDAITKVSSLASCVTHDSPDEASKSRKKSGRTRQRAAKYWSSVRCRTPSPEPGVICRFAQCC